MDFQIILHFLTASALAGLIGTEREIVQRSMEVDHISRKLYGGVRTHILLAIFGGMTGLLSKEFVNPMLLIAGLMVVALFIGSYYLYNLFIEKHVGLTSELSGILTYMLGVLCLVGYTSLAVILGIALTILLTSKEYLSHIFRHVEQKELFSTLKFAVVLFVILPLLPDYSLDAWGVIDLYDIWKVVVMISGISYVGFILSKTVGASQGIIISGILGGLASSTAVASAMAGQSKKNTNLVSPFVIATVVASSIMFFRVLFWVASFNVSLLQYLAIPVLSMGFVSAMIVAVLWYRSKKAQTTHDHAYEVPLESPFQILPALKFALFFVFVSFLSELAARYMGDMGIYGVSLISGLADVDSITLKLAQQTSAGGLDSVVATKGIILAVMANTFVKMLLAKLFGGKDFGNSILACFLLILAAGGLSLFFI